VSAALLVAGTLALGGATATRAVRAVRRERVRLAALQELAAARGWSWTARDDAWTTALPGPPSRLGERGPRAEHVLRGPCGGRELVAFDASVRTHTYDANGVASTTVHRSSVLALRLPVALPRVELEGAGRGDGLARLLGRAVELESADFRARYRVRADDPRLAHALLPARSLQLLLDRPDLPVHLEGHWAVSRAPGRLEPAELLSRLDTLGALLDAVPAWLWREHA
jgi:hypothetical protein